MAANLIDLCTVADLHSYLGITKATTDDPLLQSLITSASQYWLTRTCRGALNRVVDYVERYDGNDRDTLLLNQFPVQSVSEVLVDNVPVPASTDYVQPGWILDQKKSCLLLIGTRTLFWCGRMNVKVTYSAGYPATPPDILEAVVKQVATNYKRKGTLDQSSMMIGQGEGQTSFRSWAVAPEVEQVIQAYRRYWP